MKKTVCFLLLLTLLLSFAGCRSEEAPPPVSSSSSSFELVFHPTTYGFSIALAGDGSDGRAHLVESHDETVPQYLEVEYLGQTLELDYEKTVYSPSMDVRYHKYLVRNSRNDVGETGSASFDMDGNLLSMYFVYPGVPIPIAENVTQEELRAQIEVLMSEYIDFSVYNDFRYDNWYIDASGVTASLRWVQKHEGMSTCNTAYVSIRGNEVSLYTRNQTVEIPESLTVPTEEAISSAVLERLTAELSELGYELLDYELGAPDIATCSGKLSFRAGVTFGCKNLSTQEEARGFRIYILLPDEFE